MLQVWCTPKRAQAIVIVVCLAAAAATLPEFFEFTVAETGNSNITSSVVQLRIETTEFGRSSFYSLGYKYANQALFTFLPLVLLLVFNTLLIYAVLAAARRRQQMAKTGRDVSAASDRQDRQRRGQQRITVSLSFELELDLQAHHHFQQYDFELELDIDARYITVFIRIEVYL